MAVVPDYVPDGWFVCGIRRSYQDRPPFSPFTLYGELDGDGTLHGRALAVGNVSDEFGFASLSGTRRKVQLDRRYRPGELTRSGDWAWLTWQSPDYDANRLIAARGLADKQIVAAARATKRLASRSLRIEPRALPRNVRLITTAAIEPSDDDRYGSLIILEAEDGGALIAVDAYRASNPDRALQDFWAEQAPRRENALQAVVVERDGSVIYAEGDVAPSVLRSVARSLRPADDAEWEAFREGSTGVPVRYLDECNT